MNNKMFYSSEQIVDYMKVLNSYKNNYHQPEKENKVRCKKCQGDRFTIYLGQHVCEECGVFNGYILGYFDIKEKDRFFYKKKSIYNRKYYYEKKVDQISKRINLNDKEKYQLYNELMKINDSVMKKQNKKFCRKRMINIFYLIRNILKEIGNKKYKLVYLKISPQTFKKYEKWWENYISLR